MTIKTLSKLPLQFLKQREAVVFKIACFIQICVSSLGFVLLQHTFCSMNEVLLPMSLPQIILLKSISS